MSSAPPILVAVMWTAFNGNVTMEHLLPLEALAAILGVKKTTLYVRRAKDGNLPPAIKIGGRLRFRQADVQAWLAEQPASVRTPGRTRTPVTEQPGKRTDGS